MATGIGKNKENKKKVVAKDVGYYASLTYHISATECPIEIKFSVPELINQGLEHIRF